jgi:hypothetical protein
MRSVFTKLTHAAAVAGLLCGLAATPALADHDHDRHWNKHHWRERHSEWRPRHHHRDYDRSYYYYSEPRDYYYSSPRLYVPVPPPPSFGLNLVFPIH